MITTIEHGAVRELRLNHPPVNALTPKLIADLRKRVEEAPPAVRALVLSGAPGMFSAGLDVPLLLKLDRPAMEQLWRDFYALLRALACSPIPIAAAMTGHAPAGGTVLTLFCDWRVLAQGDWKIGLSEVQVGLILPPVIYQAFRRQVGTRAAGERAVRGLLFSASEAERIGMVEELAPAERVVERAVEWCQSLLALPQQAMLTTRAQTRADLTALFAQGVEREIAGVVEMWWNPETQAALHAFVEKLGKKK
ncbi:MAG: enoyl-CoA hydratase/isomerase family protein [Candidatus Sulfotelmatobacter sp.]